MGQSNYRPELDGIRAFCILLTVANHMPGKPAFINGTIGVDIFFALSGWLISHLLFSEKAQSGTISIKSFYLRRFFRIVPLYVLTIVLYWMAALVSAKLTGVEDDLREFFAALPWLTTFNSEYRPGAAGNIFGHAWTLGIEEKFYIVWPILVASTIAGRREAFVVIVPVLLGLMMIGGEISALIRGYLGLGFGALLAGLAQRGGVKSLLESTTSIYGAFVFICIFYIAGTWKELPIWNVLTSFSAAIFIGGVWINRNTIAGKILSLKPFAFAGKITYAIYLIHVLVVNTVSMIFEKAGLPDHYATKFLVVYGICILVSALLHFGIEKPFIRVGRNISLGWRVPPHHYRHTQSPSENS